MRIDLYKQALMTKSWSVAREVMRLENQVYLHPTEDLVLELERNKGKAEALKFAVEELGLISQEGLDLA